MSISWSPFDFPKQFISYNHFVKNNKFALCLKGSYMCVLFHDVTCLECLYRFSVNFKLQSYSERIIQTFSMPFDVNEIHSWVGTFSTLVFDF